MSTPLLTTGLNGLVGSKLASLFADAYQFDNLDVTNPSRPVDITNAEAVNQVVSASPANAIVHFAAYTDVTGAWQQQGDKTGPAYQVNVVGTQNLLAAAESTGKHFIHISTAYVFDGQKTSPYLESDPLSPIEWYGQTKAWAEETVQSANIPWTILRIDQPFRRDTVARPDVVRRIAAQLQTNTLKPQFTDHVMGPTYIDDFAKVIDWVIRTQTTGLFNASSGETWSDYDFAKAIQSALNLPGQIEAGSLKAYLATAARPYQPNTSLDVSKLKSALDFSLKSVVDALSEVTL